jgi:hypothetical protein
MTSDGLATEDVVSLCLAGYAALISTAVAFRQFWLDRPRAKVAITPVHIAVDGRGLIHELWEVQVVNLRARPIEVTQVGLSVSGATFSRYLPMLVEDLDGEPLSGRPPTVIGEGMSTTYHFRQGDLSDDPFYGSAVVTGAWIRDSLGHEHNARLEPRTPSAVWRRYRLRRTIARLE